MLFSLEIFLMSEIISDIDGRVLLMVTMKLLKSGEYIQRSKRLFLNKNIYMKQLVLGRMRGCPPTHLFIGRKILISNVTRWFSMVY